MFLKPNKPWILLLKKIFFNSKEYFWDKKNIDFESKAFETLFMLWVRIPYAAVFFSELKKGVDESLLKEILVSTVLLCCGVLLFLLSIILILATATLSLNSFFSKEGSLFFLINVLSILRCRNVAAMISAPPEILKILSLATKALSIWLAEFDCENKGISLKTWGEISFLIFLQDDKYC